MGMNVVAKIRQATRRKHTAEEKIRIVLEGLQGEIPISELCRRFGDRSDDVLPLVEAVLRSGIETRFFIRIGDGIHEVGSVSK